MADHPLFRKITIVGVGLIGGSIGMAIKKNGLAQEVVGISRRHGPLVIALRSGAIDKISHDLKKAVEGADLVILATPVKTILSQLPEIGRYLKRGCFVTDVGSTKSEIVLTAQRSLPHYVSFVGSHPMAGSEKTGAMYAHSELFKNSVCLMTPTDKTNKFAKEKVALFWTKLGMTVKFLTPGDHDQILAFISHVPHLVAFSLIRAVPPGYLEFAAGGFKDTTRIASSDPKMWSDICLANPKNVLKALDEVVKHISSLRKSIIFRKEQELIEYFKESKARRDGIS